MEKEARLIYRCKLPESTAQGAFFPPQAFEIDSIKRLEREVFGPVLHVVRFKASELDKVIDAVVGVQPFGGEGLSGTGPKAGGNASLMSLEEDDAGPKPALPPAIDK